MKLIEVNQFKYLGSTQTSDGISSVELKIRLAQAHSAMTSLAVLWKNKAISFPTKIKLYKSLVLLILLYGCESWTLARIWRDESKPWKTNAAGGSLAKSYKEHETISYVWQQVYILAGRQELLFYFNNENQ